MSSHITPVTLNIESVALHYLMTRFVETGCPKVAWAIVHHLSLLLRKDDAPLCEKQQQSYQKLFDYWQNLAHQLSKIPDARDGQTVSMTLH